MQQAEFAPVTWGGTLGGSIVDACWTSELKRHLYLTGYRGSGKTSVGRILAQACSLPLVDLDAEIESTAGMTIREIFEAGGESRFRNLETAQLQRVAAGPASVISLGGGAVLRQENFDLIAATGWCVWLDADAAALLARIQGDTTSGERRPALTTQTGLDEINTLLAARRPLYSRISSLRIDTTDQSLESITTRIADWFRLQTQNSKPDGSGTC